MSEFKGTKGKWFISSNSIKNYKLDEDTRRYGKIDISTHDWSGFIQCCRHEMNENDDESKANELLISKAPEMLEMLKSCVIAFKQIGMEEPVGVTKLIREATEL
jgi:hypothetical protein